MLDRGHSIRCKYATLARARARSPKGKIELPKYHPEFAAQAAKLAKQGAIDRELPDHFGVIPIARPCSRLTDPLCQGVGARPA
jgi:hypothetical protein